VANSTSGAAAARAVVFFGVWLAIAGWDVKDLPVGVAAAAAATWASLALFPRLAPGVRPGALAALALSFLRGSLAAGFDVARRALSPRPDVNPGFVSFRLRIPVGLARNAFSALSSLQPGALPTGAEDGALVVHAIDVTWPVEATLAADERLFMRALGYE
jgi:multicomponent Na+:H+ antiporter subunit E